MKYLFVLCSILLGLSITSCTKDEIPCDDYSLVESDILDDELYKIIEPLIDSYDNSDNFHIEQESHFVTDSTVFSRYFENVVTDLSLENIDSYKEQNSSASIWGDNFEKNENIISTEEISCLFESASNGWDAYYSKYEDSKAILKIGVPFYENDHAIFTFIYQCHYECNTGHTVTLKKENGQWKIIKNYIIWIG